MGIKDDALKTPEQREEIVRRLARAVFHEFADAAMARPSGTFDNETMIEHARKGVSQYRRIEKFLLSRAKEINYSALCSG